MPEDLNFLVSSLPEYVEQNRDVILRTVVLEGNTIRRMVPQTGIKTKAAINYLDVDVEFQDGSECGFTAQDGGIELSQREIETGIIKINLDVCPKKLLGKYAEFLVRIKATEEELPFEEFIVTGIINDIRFKLEKAVWQGDKDSSDKNLNKFDGLLKLVNAENETVKITYAAGASVWDRIKAVVLAIPEAALTKGAISVFISPEDFRAFMLEMVEKNFYHYSGPQDEGPEEFVFPGTNMTVVKSAGLMGTGSMYGTFDRNLYFGCDLENASETVSIKWDDINELFKIKVLFNAGVQVAFPDMGVLSTRAADPTPTPVTITGATSLNLTAAAGSNERTYATSDGSDVEAEVTSENSDWLTVSAEGKKVTFTKTAYAYDAEGTDPRVATVRVSSGDAYLDVTVRQAMAAEA